MFGSELTTYPSRFYSQTMTTLSYDMPGSNTYSTLYPLSQPYRNFLQTGDVPMQHTIQPIIMPTPIGVPVPQPVPIPIDRPCAVPVPQPVPVPVDRPYAVPIPQLVPVPVDRPYGVPVPIPMPVPQPVAVPQPVVVQEAVPVPVPVPVQVSPPQEYIRGPTFRPVEYIIEEPVRIIRRGRRRRRRCRSYSRTPPLAPIVIPYPMQAPAPAPAPSYQITEYIQDIYPPAQVFTEQVPIGYVVKNSSIEQPTIIQSQSSPNIVQSSSGQVQQVQVIQELPNGQIVQRPLNLNGVNVRSAIY